jgi:LDH2 family malate/lactate/ureidoglycolate dehydrogenase
MREIREETVSFAVHDVRQFVTALLAKAGMDEEKSAAVARLLVLTDAMGRRTHGVAMLLLYLKEIQNGTMRIHGEPEVVRDNGITAVWDGDYLPGMWLVEKAILQAMPRAAEHGIAAVAIRRSHHIGCLAALAKIAADQGFVALITNSDPAGQRVAPYGGTEALMTPNPLAFGYPGEHHPVLVDMCASITTTSMTRQKVAEGKLFDHPWLQDAHGVPTCDPTVLENTTTRGSLLPLGGQEYGHKGYGLSLMVEALSQGLSGHGRKDAPKRWGGNTYVQVMSPDMFAGGDAFAEQMDHLSDRCRTNKPINPAQPVRVPGDAAAKSISDAQKSGISYDVLTWAGLCDWAAKLGVDVPVSP